MELYDGRPADTAGREEKEIRVYDLLDSLGIKYKRTDHAPATTMEVCDVIDAVLDRSILVQKVILRLDRLSVIIGLALSFIR